MATIKKKNWSGPRGKAQRVKKATIKKKNMILPSMNSFACIFCTGLDSVSRQSSFDAYFSVIFGSFWPPAATSQRVLSPSPPCRRPTCSSMLRRARTFPRKGVLEKHTHTHTDSQIETNNSHRQTHAHTETHEGVRNVM